MTTPLPAPLGVSPPPYPLLDPLPLFPFPLFLSFAAQTLDIAPAVSRVFAFPGGYRHGRHGRHGRFRICARKQIQHTCKWRHIRNWSMPSMPSMPIDKS